MNLLLNDNEVRVLGCFIEKETTTPEYYPLTLNALTNACNQKSNRDPVVAFDETDVVRALDRLRHFGLAMQAGEGGRVPRYRHSLMEKLHLEPEELAVLAELMLRGPQTVGEIRGRADRMHPLDSLEEVEAILKALSEREVPLVVQLPRQPGRKECRHMHLLAGMPDHSDEAAAPPSEAATLKVRAEDERIAALESELAALRAEFTVLRQEMAAFREQFE
ncbi:YceH family protein [Trichloromonas sp.]|uniref:YceH family protein n=1 Tax=Trichloromonas sp. TaxID=3069249 RepID=UPI003D81AC3A